MFTQESVLTSKRLEEYKITTKINPKYSLIGWEGGSFGIGIHYDQTKFIKNSKIIRIGYKGKEISSNEGDIRITHKNVCKDTMYIDDALITEQCRPIMCVKLENIITGENIVFINLWAPHHIINKGKNKDFINGLNECLERVGYIKGERIIIAGDFNEYYKQGKEKTESIELTNNNGTENYTIKLTLKQIKPTCCGSGRLSSTEDDLADKDGKRPFDLVYDSFGRENQAIVYNDILYSDHKPISYNFNISEDDNRDKTEKFKDKKWCYDFDGVVHLSMKEDDQWNKTDDTSRHPNQDVLNEFENNYINLLDYVFGFTIAHMLYGQRNGATIYIVSANSKRKYKEKIKQLLKHFGIKIDDNIYMGKTDKKETLTKTIKADVFVDDSCKNITALTDEGKPIVETLIFSIPENRKYYKINTLGKICDVGSFKDIDIKDFEEKFKANITIMEKYDDNVYDNDEIIKATIAVAAKAFQDDATKV